MQEPAAATTVFLSLLFCLIKWHLQGDRPAAGSSVQHPLPSRRVTWPDMQGHDLTSVREFEPSEPGEYDIGFGGWDNKQSCCSIM